MTITYPRLLPFSFSNFRPRLCFSISFLNLKIIGLAVKWETQDLCFENEWDPKNSSTSFTPHQLIQKKKIKTNAYIFPIYGGSIPPSF